MLKHSPLFFALLTLLLPWTVKANFTYEGTLFDPNGHPVTNSNVVLRLEVLSPTNCILRSETQTVDLSGTSGYFSVSVGTGTPTGTNSAYSMEQIFQNGKTFTSLQGCDSGSYYTSGPTDTRKLRVFVTVGGGTEEALGSLTINAVPMATSAASIGDSKAEHLLRVNTSEMPGGVTAFSSTQWNELLDLISGTSGQYIPAGAGGSGTVTSITAGTGLSGGTITSSGTLSVNVGTSSGQIPQLDVSGKLPLTTIPPDFLKTSSPIGGDLSGSFNAPTVSKLQGRQVSNNLPTSGQLLRYDGFEWKPAPIGLGDLLDGFSSPQFPTSCNSVGSNYTLSWNSLTGAVSCIPININVTNLDSTVLNRLWEVTLSPPGNIYRPSGKVGIGTSTPESQLHVTNGSDSTSTRLIIQASQASPTVSPSLLFRALPNSGDTQNNQSLGRIAAYGAVSGTPSTGAEINFKSMNNWTFGNYSTGISFHTNDGGTLSERMTIDSNGNVGIGVTSPAYMLHLSGTAIASAWNISSDRRLKQNIQNIPSPLEKILALNGVEFDWRKDIDLPVKQSKTHDIGVIAQEVEKVFPEAVESSKEGYKSVAYSKLIAPLIEAVKALYYHKADAHSVHDLQARLEKTEKENQELRARLEVIERALLSK